MSVNTEIGVSGRSVMGNAFSPTNERPPVGGSSLNVLGVFAVFEWVMVFESLSYTQILHYELQRF